jgi:serine/threonine-protein kinase
VERAFDLRSSFHFGRGGVDFVRLLACRRVDESLLRRVLAGSRRARGGPSEFLGGVAGHLTCLVILYRATREPRLLSLADDLAGDLLSSAHGRTGWTRAKRLPFAHGRAGTFYALLSWSLAANRSLPARLFDDLARLAADVEATLHPDGDHDLSWCNGASGFVLLWVRAYERTGVAHHRRLAQKAARSLVTLTRGAWPDLCCGLGGRAYALLAMDRIDPGRGWYERSVALAEAAAEGMLASSGPWPNGVHKGYPGLVCLADDLSRPPSERLGFPLVEG